MRSSRAIWFAVALSACGRSHGSAGPTSSVAPAPSPSVTTTPTGPDDLSAFLLQYGKPDVDDTTAFDRTPPPMVTRWFIYRKEHVRVTFVPDGPADAGLAKRWDLVAIQDDRTKRAISNAEAASRLALRSVSSQ